MTTSSHVYELFGGRTLHLAYYTDVKNSASLLHKILSNELNVSLINADTVVSLFRVHAAASRALLSVQNHLTPEHIQVLKKHYKIQDLELQVTTLSDAIVS
ncbi:hypothetical protein DYB37_014072, partial [Aphanomyces astaci]